MRKTWLFCRCFLGHSCRRHSTKLLQDILWTAWHLLILTTVKSTKKAERLSKCCMCFMLTLGRYIPSKWNWQWKGEKKKYDAVHQVQWHLHYVLTITWRDVIIWLYNQVIYVPCNPFSFACSTDRIGSTKFVSNDQWNNIAIWLVWH